MAVMGHSQRMSIRLERVTSRGRFSQGSLTLGTRIPWVGLGDRDKFIEDGIEG